MRSTSETQKILAVCSLQWIPSSCLLITQSCVHISKCCGKFSKAIFHYMHIEICAGKIHNATCKNTCARVEGIIWQQHASLERKRVNTSTTMHTHISTNYSITLKVTTKQFVYELLDDTREENVHSYGVCLHTLARRETCCHSLR